MDKQNDLHPIAQKLLGDLEVGVMMRLRHPRIVAFLGAGEIMEPALHFGEPPRVGIFVVLEFAAGGDLTHRLADAGGSLIRFPWSERIQCAVDISEGMAFIHEKGFIHRDLKSLNILCDSKGRCMIADLGLVRHNIPAEEKNEDATVAGEETEQPNQLVAYGATACKLRHSNPIKPHH